jgi:gamma-glutamylcyclotransferase (GGCT)/AIG2-like uncharacterized protein YtfP
MERLFVYGTLRPGHSNAYILENIGGEWLPGYVTGTFYERGWGAAADFPGLCYTKTGRRSVVTCLSPDNLEAHWPMLDEFEEATIALRLTSPHEWRAGQRLDLSATAANARKRFDVTPRLFAQCEALLL